MRSALAATAGALAVAAAVLAPTPASATLQPLPIAASTAAAAALSTFHPIRALTAYAPKRKVGPGPALTVPLAGRGGLPAAGDFTAVALAVTLSQAAKSTTAAVFPTGSATPIKVVTAPVQRSVTGFTILPVTASGAVRVRLSGGHARIRVVVEGYQQAGTRGASFHPLASAPVLTPRRLGPGASRSVSILGAARTGLPSNGRIAAVALAVTASHATRPSTVTTYPRGQSASSGAPAVSARPGPATSGLAVVKVGSHGDVALRNAHGHVTVGAEVEGYWTTDPTGAGFRSVTPRALYNGTTAAMRWRRITVAGRGGLPTAGRITAALLSVRASRAAGPAYLAVAPTAHGVPSTGPVRVAAGSPVATSVVARVSGGAVRVFASRRMHLTVSVVGWYGRTADGTDVSTGSCGAPLAAGATFAVIAATNGQPYQSPDPTCFAAQTAQAQQLPAAPQFYLNLADPGKASTANWGKGGPRTCHLAHDYDLGCAYDYGYGAAKHAVAFAAAHGTAVGSRWWVDVEIGNSWGSPDLDLPGHVAANVADLRGALRYLGAHGYPAGVYTETAWWDAITGSSRAFSTVPVWGGGADSRSRAWANCKQVSITGGPALLAQWFTDVQHDRDIAC